MARTRSHCDHQACRTRTHGVGVAGGFPVIDALAAISTNPALRIVTVEGHSAEVPTNVLLDYRLMRRAFALPPLMRIFREMKVAH